MYLLLLGGMFPYSRSGSFIMHADHVVNLTCCYTKRLLFIIITHNASYLFLHLVLQLCHLLCVFWVTGDVFLIEERL